MQARPTVPRTWPGCAAVGALSGGLVALGFDWTALAWLSPVAIACLLVTLRGQSVCRSALVGYCFGVGFFGLLLWWMVASIGFGGWIALTVVQAAWFALAAAGTRCVAELRGSPIWVAAIWTFVELAREQWPLGGFPWGRLGFIVVDTPWVGLLPYVGVTGAGLLVVAVAQAMAVAARARDLRSAAVPALAAVASLLPVVFPFAVDSEESWTVATVQGGVPGRGNDVGANHREVTRNHVSATLDLARRVDAGELAAADLVVWPENSTAVDPVKDLQTREGLTQAAAAVGVPLLVGALVDGSSSREVLNQGVVWSPSGPTGVRYTKHHPVPFGEYIPFRPLFSELSERFERIPRDMKAGAGSAPLMINGVKVADAICFDIAYDDVVPRQVRNGAELVVVQTSNATFTGTSQLEQQFAITRARAAETGRAVVVASTNGITGIIAPDGEVVARAAVKETTYLVEEVPLSTDLTPAVRWAGVLHIAPVLLALLGLLGAWLRGRQPGAGSSRHLAAPKGSSLSESA